MEQPITVKFRWSPEDLFQGHCCHRRQQWRPMFRAAFSAVVYGTAVLGVIGAIAAHRHGDLSAGHLIVPLFGLFWLLRLPILRWLVKRRFAKRPDRDMEVQWEISPEKLSIQSPLGHAELAWEAFSKVVRAPSGILFYPVDQIFHFLPRRGFSSQAEFEQVTALAQNKARTFRTIV